MVLLNTDNWIKSVWTKKTLIWGDLLWKIYSSVDKSVKTSSQGYLGPRPGLRGRLCFVWQKFTFSCNLSGEMASYVQGTDQHWEWHPGTHGSDNLWLVCDWNIVEMVLTQPENNQLKNKTRPDSASVFRLTNTIDYVMLYNFVCYVRIWAFFFSVTKQEALWLQ